MGASSFQVATYQAGYKSVIAKELYPIWPLVDIEAVHGSRNGVRRRIQDHDVVGGSVCDEKPTFVLRQGDAPTRAEMESPSAVCPNAGRVS